MNRERNTQFVQAYLTPELKDKFKDICVNKGATTSGVIRQLVIQYVKENE